MPANAEHERFLTLFQRMVDHTDAWIAKTPKDKLDWVPIQTSAMRFGERVSKVTIKGLIAHIVVGEAFWSMFLKDCADGTKMVPPPNFKLANEFEKSGDFRTLAHKTQVQSMEGFRSFSAS
jgi:hypothetical protein